MLLTFGLFETAADVQAATNDLVKSGLDPSSLWLIVRDLEADTGEQDDRRTTIARLLVALDLAGIARHFRSTGLVVFPKEGAYLVAGWPVRELTARASVDGASDQTELCRILVGAGCEAEEAGFLDGRLQAGTLLLGVAADDEERLETAREIFADQQAIHVGTATMPTGAWQRWNAASAPKPDTSSAGEAVVLDFSSLLVVGPDDDSGDIRMIGQTLFDRDEAEVGAVSAIVIDPEDGNSSKPVYIVVRNGGFLGVGRHEYVIPFEMIDAEPGTEHFRARMTRDLLENAPAYDAELPISRREELLICGYYGTAPYWEQ
ncbi:hypothetical protein BH23CHL2_BH23CHL2_11610 [soil metagenome]